MSATERGAQFEQLVGGSANKVLRAKRELERGFDSLPFLMLVLTDQRQILRVNRTVEKWGMGSVKEFVGRDVGALFESGGPSKEIHDQLQAAWAQFLVDGRADWLMTSRTHGSLVCSLQSCADSSYAGSGDDQGHAVLLMSRYQKLDSEGPSEETEMERIEGLIRLEREELARDLHDGIAQSLLAIKYSLENLDGDNLTGQVTQLVAFLRETIEEVRRLMGDVVADTIVGSNILIGRLESVLSHYRNSWMDIDWRLRSTLEPELSMSQRQARAVQRIVQEACSNAARHSGATTISVSLNPEADGIRLCIDDDGCGIAVWPSDNPTAFGLRNLQARVTVASGDLIIRSTPGEGTSIRVRLPAGVS